MKTLSIILFSIFSITAIAQNQDSTSVRKDSITLNKNLSEVVVKGKNVTHSGNKDIYTITRKMREGTISTAQLLGNLPGMDYNLATKELRYKGTNNIKILVDSIDKDESYIKELDHARFSKIDVIHNPSGKYQNYDVVINLHTKQDYEGYDGYLQSGTDLYFNDRNGKGKNIGALFGSGSFTYTKNKLNLSVFHNMWWYDNNKDYFEQNTYLNNNIKEEIVKNKDGSENDINYDRNNKTSVNVDYKINNNHSLSLGYYMNITSIDNRRHRTLIQSDVTGQNAESIMTDKVSGNNGNRHMLFLNYRGKSGLWDFNASVNGIIYVWKTSDHTMRSTGFEILDDRRNRQNLLWSNIEATHKNSNETIYTTFGYSNNWKEYWIKLSGQDEKINSLVNRRNNLYASIDYQPDRRLSLGLSGSLQFVNNTYDGKGENYVLYNLGAKLYYKFNKNVWARLNVLSNYNQPTLQELAGYGNFTDSLLWVGGNPNVKSYTAYKMNATVGLYDLVTLEGGCSFLPDRFALIAEERNGIRPDGINGPYVAKVWQNTKYRTWWVSASLWKRWNNLTFSLFAKWNDAQAEYSVFSNHYSWLSGNVTSTYFIKKLSLYLQFRYGLEQSYVTYPQSNGKWNLDNFTLCVQKTWFKNRLVMQLFYVLPVHIVSGDIYERLTTGFYNSYSYSNNQDRVNNRLGITFRYRFNGGKSVHKYNWKYNDEH